MTFILTHSPRVRHVLRNSTIRANGIIDGQCFFVHMIECRSEKMGIVQFVSRRLKCVFRISRKATCSVGQ